MVFGMVAFAWAIAFVRRPIFKLLSFLGYFVFFRASGLFSHNVLVEWFLACFWHFQFVTQGEHF